MGLSALDADLRLAQMLCAPQGRIVSIERNAALLADQYGGLLAAALDVNEAGVGMSTVLELGLAVAEVPADAADEALAVAACAVVVCRHLGTPRST